MKRCPKCDFSFADFHHVCDFDGTELVDAPETLALARRPVAKTAVSASPVLRVLKSPLFLTALAVMALVASAVLIGYYDSANQPNSIAQNSVSRDAVATRIPPAQPSAQIQKPAPSSTRSDINNPRAAKDSSSGRGRTLTASSRTRLHSSASIRDQQSRSRIARQKQSDTAAQKESREIAQQREPKLTALLKTTWHILKKPFKF